MLNITICRIRLIRCMQIVKKIVVSDIEIGNIHCHHKIPYSKTHDDSYGNLILICQEAHILIHAVNNEVIQYYKNVLKLNAQQIGKINKLRKLLNLAEI